MADHEKSELSAPVQVQSRTTCQFVAGVTSGGVVSLAAQNVACTVSRPPVASDATGAPLIVDGEMSHVASYSLV